MGLTRHSFVTLRSTWTGLAGGRVQSWVTSFALISEQPIATWFSLFAWKAVDTGRSCETWFASLSFAVSTGLPLKTCEKNNAHAT